MAYIEVTGLEELINECERLGGKGSTETVNRRILKKAAKLTQGEAKSKAPRSGNPMTSGRKGSRTGKHMGDNIPLSGVKNKNGSLYIIVGWNKGDNSPFFYAKFIEYGTSKIPANPFLLNALNKYKKDFELLAKVEYEKLIEKLR